MLQLFNSLFHRSSKEEPSEQDSVVPACSELHTPNISFSQKMYSGLRRILCPTAAIIEVSWDEGKTWLPLDRDNSKQIERVRAKQTISCVDIRNDRHLCRHLTHEGADIMIKVWLKEEHRQLDENDSKHPQWSVRRVKNWKTTYLGRAEVPQNEVPNTKWIYLPGPPQYESTHSPTPSSRVDSATSSIHESQNNKPSSPLDVQPVKKLCSKPSHEFTFQCPLPTQYQYPVLPSKGFAMKSSQNLRHQFSASSLFSMQSDFDTELESCGWRITQMQCQPSFDLIQPLRYTAMESYGAVEGVLAC
ncbi:hypothetical protein Unana1_04903 [Umbelopsis nana]